jgi:8-oxo-dGTP diphosphatase
MKPILAVNVLLTDADARLVLHQRAAGARYAPGFWAPFGGKVDFGETAVAAAVRELREESGLEIEPERLIPFAFIEECRSFHPDYHFSSLIFRSTLLRGEHARNNEPEKCDGVGSFALDALPQPIYRAVPILLAALAADPSGFSLISI